MPIYEYECVKCGEKFEEYCHTSDLNKIKEDEIKCPNCGAAETQRVYSTFGFGGGFSCSTGSDSGYISSG